MVYKTLYVHTGAHTLTYTPSMLAMNCTKFTGFAFMCSNVFNCVHVFSDVFMLQEHARLRTKTQNIRRAQSRESDRDASTQPANGVKEKWCKHTIFKMCTGEAYTYTCTHTCAARDMCTWKNYVYINGDLFESVASERGRRGTIEHKN